jgi:hypothetical protein
MGMTREHLRQYYPDTAAFFAHVGDAHPFWQEVGRVDLNDALAGGTLLTDLEQMFASLSQVDGHHVIHDHLEEITTKDQLMEMLTRLYVAYLYRTHGPRLVSGEHGYDIEVEIADQLLALGVVRFKNFESLHEQFEAAIEDDLDHLDAMKDQDGKRTESLDEFITHLKAHAKRLGEHPTAAHQVIATVTEQGALANEVALARRIASSKQEMQEAFPHIAGLVLIDPTPGKERAKFLPFHGDDSNLEALLTRHG